MPERPIVVKVGGSLYDLPDLGSKLRAWLATQSAQPVLIVPGGGAAANVIRQLDQTHHLGEEQAHWLALRALTLNAHWLKQLLPGAAIIGDALSSVGQTFLSVSGQADRNVCPTQRTPSLNADGSEGACWPCSILDALAFAVADDRRPGALPHTWEATSDSIALRAVVVAGARELILLKSVSIPANLNWEEVSRQGYVDPLFPRLLRDAHDLKVRAVNFRQWQPEAQRATAAPGGEPCSR